MVDPGQDPRQWARPPADGEPPVTPPPVTPPPVTQPPVPVPTGGYGPPPGPSYGPPAGYGPPPGYAPPAAYGPPAGYAPPPGYGPVRYAVGTPAPSVAIGRIEPVPGTPFALAIVNVPPVRSGAAIGAMVAGIASILVSLVVFCFGISGANPGWGPLVAGAFAILGLALGGAGIGIGTAARRAIARAAGALGGRGAAQTGLICGWIGVGLTVLAFAGSVAATVST